MLNNNDLKGSLQRSLVNCEKLELLDLGNHKISDTFPFWLENLPNLQIIGFRVPQAIPRLNLLFQKLRVIDISNNEFVGRLPSKYIDNFEAVVNVDCSPDMNEDLEKFYTVSMVVTVKGREIEFQKILSILTAIDFTGRIPELIGKLKSLKGLNFSHNHINDSIPQSLANLTNLDRMAGPFIKQAHVGFDGLADLTFLAFHECLQKLSSTIHLQAIIARKTWTSVDFRCQSNATTTTNMKNRLQKCRPSKKMIIRKGL